MRIRTGLTPDAWRDDGPGAAHASVSQWSSRPAFPIGEMIPFAVAPAIVSEADRARASARNRTRREAYQAKARTLRPPVVECAAALRLSGICGRGVGHPGPHSSRAALERKAINRTRAA